MFPRFQTSLRAVLGFLLASLLPSLAFATSYGPPREAGIAAVDVHTGKVVWEAWLPDDVPKDVSEVKKTAVKILLNHPKSFQGSHSPIFPASLAKNRVVTFVDADSKRHLILSHGQPQTIVSEIARFSFDYKTRCKCALSGNTLYVFLDGKVHALVGTKKEEVTDANWKPAWAFDVLAELPAPKRETARCSFMQLQANEEGVWVVVGPRILQLTPQGRKQARYEMKSLFLTWGDQDFSPSLVFGKRLLYFCCGYGVVALDRHSKREGWRLPTMRAPYPSRVLEIQGNLALIQIGSDVPQTIESALGATAHPFPKLSPNTTSQRVAAAMLLHSYGDGSLRTQLRKCLAELRKMESDPDAKQATAILDRLLATWPRKRDRQLLIDTCVTSLLQAEGKKLQPAFATPATQRVLTWCLLQELIYGFPDDAYNGPGDNFAYHRWEEMRLWLAEEVAAKLAEHCRHVIATGPEAEKPFAASVLVSRTVGWYRLTDAERKDLFLSPHPSIWRWTAMSLVKNGWREELIRWAPHRPVADHLDIIWILADKMPKEWSKAEPKEWPKAELDFWLACARHKPGGVAYVLNLKMEGTIPIAFRAPIRSYLEKEIANPTVKDSDQQETGYLFATVSVLDRWKNPDDTPVLLKCLKHPYIRLRGHVKNLLENRGVKPAPGIVYEEDRR